MRSLPRRLLLSLAVAAPLCALATEEVPFITSPDNVTLEMLRLADVKAADHVIDLGSGDGRIVILAARRFGASGLGVEIDPQLVALSQKNARDAGVAERAVFREQDLFKTDLTKASVITMYLLPDVNLQLRPVLLDLKPGTRLVSHDWDLGDWKPDQTTVVPVPDKKVGLEKSSKVHLWVVPAKVAGLWCGTGPLGEFSLRLTQRYQEVEGTLTRKGRDRKMTARMQGATMRTTPHERGALVANAVGSELRITGGEGPFMLLRGQVFQRAAAAACGGG
jgi:SAM-dependent methyltransferase